MTTISALIPRLRHRRGQVVSIRCSECRTWRKPRYFDRASNTCQACTYSAAHRRIRARAA
jgi:hypothetical protein